MPAPTQIHISAQHAFARIAAEMANSQGQETGGLLVGRLFATADGPTLVVVAASGPGPRAQRDAHSFAPDVDDHQAELEHWCQFFSDYGVDYVGEWHSHHAGPATLSSGDLRQARAILDDPSYYLPDGICLPLATLIDGQLTLASYYLARDAQTPQLVPYTVISDDVREALERWGHSEPRQKIP
ncbi:MAG: hypothetical protein HGA45_21280 [Chloroflexales bacterium]|nr:hypothetical protein [Chloroflexales bacterium]